MAVKIRLKREGSKGRPYYRIVVADARAPKEGRIIEQIGNYDPAIEGENYKLDLEKAEKWIGNGAQPSETVRSIIKKARRSAAAEA
jgi:small subunit ribosomal protein S16